MVVVVLQLCTHPHILYIDFCIWLCHIMHIYIYTLYFYYAIVQSLTLVSAVEDAESSEL